MTARAGDARVRVPIHPVSPADLEEGLELVCRHCAHGRELHRCEVFLGMVDLAAGTGDSPEGGWVIDPGAGQTCLSYAPRSDRPRVSRQQLRRLARMNPATLPPVCGGCAARKGSEASVSLHTRRDFEACVKAPSVFSCHERLGYCGGWVRAVLARAGRRVPE